jgi:hypothetical protein
MNRKDMLVGVVVVAIALIVCALVIRDGLLSIAWEIRNKPLAEFPESLSLGEVTIEQVTLEAPNATNSGHNAKITIENMRVDAQVSQPNAK